jgi:hypothetical protein
MWRRIFLFVMMVTTLVCAPGLPSRAWASDVTATTTEDNRAAVAPASRPFEPAEELVYEGEFTKLVLRGIKIAELKFTSRRADAPAANVEASNASVAREASNASVATRPDMRADAVAPVPLLFTGEITSRDWFRKLFRINFHYLVESTVEPKSFSVLRTKKLDEQGKRVRRSEAVFDRTADKITWTERDPDNDARPPRVVNVPLAGATHDIITAIYFLRTQKLTPGESFELTVSDSGAVYRVPVRIYAEKKKLKSVGGRFAVVRVEVEMFGKGRLIEEDGRMSIWMTDDERHLPLRARFDSKRGALDIILKSVNHSPRL